MFVPFFVNKFLKTENKRIIFYTDKPSIVHIGNNSAFFSLSLLVAESATQIFTW
jgi:hypothetical protein